MPAWLLFVIMSLTTYRLTRFVVRDDFPPVLWLRDRLAGGWRPLTTGESEAYTSAVLVSHPPRFDPQFTPGSPDWMKSVRSIDYEGARGTRESRYARRALWSPPWLADLLSCPWCASGWVAAGLTAAVAFTVGVPAPLLVWPAVWGAGALLASREWA